MSCDRCKGTKWILGKNGAKPCVCLKEEILNEKLSRAGLHQSERKIKLSEITELTCKKGKEIKNKIDWYAKKLPENLTCGIKQDERMKGQGLIMTGPPGYGKSFCAKALVRSAIESGYSAYIATVTWIKETIKSSFGEKTLSVVDIVAELREYDLLVLDEASAFGDKEGYIYKIIFEILNARFDAEKPTILITNLSMKQLESRVDSPTWSRISSRNWEISFDGLETKDIRKKKSASMSEAMS